MSATRPGQAAPVTPDRACHDAWWESAGLSTHPEYLPYDRVRAPQRKHWVSAAQAAIGAAAPHCPRGCGCRLGTEDAEARDCACAGLCCYDEIEVDALFAERDRLTERVDEVAAEQMANVTWRSQNDYFRELVAEILDRFVPVGDANSHQATISTTQLAGLRQRAGLNPPAVVTAGTKHLAAEITRLATPDEEARP